MKVLVAGAGAIGQWLGACLMDAGHDVTLLLRLKHEEAIQRGGLQVAGATELKVRPKTRTSAGGGPYDAILVTSKAHATAALARAVAPSLVKGGLFASIQNGFGNGSKLAAAAPPVQVAIATTTHGVMIEKPGFVRHAGAGLTHVGSLPHQGSDAGRRLHALLASAELAPTRHEDITGHVWLKGLVNHAINPLAAVAGATNGEVRAGPLWSRAVALLDEGIALSRAAGAGLPEDARAALATTLERTPTNRCSMLQDVSARRPTEIEQISGFLVRLARRLGYPLPQSEDAYRELKALEAGYLGAPASLAMARAEAEGPQSAV